MSEPTETTTHVQQYPRGTPTRPMSRKARLVVTGLLVSISTAGGALLSAKSYTDVHTFDVILALMGSFACLAGVTYDSTMFALALEVVVSLQMQKVKVSELKSIFSSHSIVFTWLLTC